MENPYLYLLKKSWKYAKNERKTFLLIYILFFAAKICISFKPILYGWFINSFQIEGVNAVKHAGIYVGAFLGLYFLEWMFHGPARLLERKLAFNISRNFQGDLFNQLLHLPVDWHKRNHSGSIINRLRKADFAMKDFFQNGSFYFQTIIQFFISGFAMLYFSPVFGLVAIFIGVLSIIAILYFDKPYVKSLEEINEGEHIASSTLTDSLTNIVTVITLKLEKQIHTELLHKINSMFPSVRKNMFIDEKKWFTAGGLVNLTYCIMVIGYVYSNYQSGETFYVGGLITLIGFVNQFTNGFIGTAIQYNQIVQYSTNVQTTNQIISEFKKVKKTKFLGSLPSDWKKIDIKGLNFNYPNPTKTKESIGIATNINDQSSPNLCDFNFTLKRGERIALIGASGSGKSTLMAVLKGLYPPEANSQLIVDGKKINDWTSLSNIVSLFPQQPEVFENTIRYNITLGLPYSDKEIKEACGIAGFSEVLQQMPKGLDTIIQEKGGNLSGGQKQRLALARGIIGCNDSSIILLDESTSNIDHHMEHLIYKSLFNKFKDKIVIASLHRLRLLYLFDYIYILGNGRIIRQGTFQEIKETTPEAI